MKRYCTILFFFLFIGGLYAQQYVPELVSKKAKAIYQKAIEAADREAYEEALQFIDQALAKDPRYVDAMLSRAGIQGQLKRYADAVKSYEQAFTVDPGYTREYQLPYCINLTGMGRFEEALKAVNDFLSIPSLSASSVKAGQYRKNNILFALQQQASVEQPFDPGFRNAGDAVNTPDPQDGKCLMFTGCDFPDGYGSCDLYISYRSADGWSRPQNLGPQINTEAWETSPCLSPDKQALYFSSTRPGGFGAADLYVSRLMPNGRWSAPENLGPAINTAGDEKAPFMHADNETLYFTSDGLQGYGGSDIFLAKKSLTGFERPLNLGFPINTIDNEGSLVVSSDGRTAFYASDRPEGKGGLDIYSFRLREELRRLATTWVQGRIYDSLTGKGMSALVELVDIQSKRLVMQVQADGEGNYLTSLPKGRNYAFSVNKKGYLFHSGRFALQGLDTVQYFNQDIAMQSLATGANITLRNILFETGKYELLPASFVELDRVVLLLQENAALKVQINGHTDNIGQPQENQLLSENRAKAVVDHLVSRGVQATRLSYKGFGASVPGADNATEQGRSLNRRTEMLVVSGS